MKRKGVYESPRLEIVDIRIEAGFAASGEGQITPARTMESWATKSNASS